MTYDFHPEARFEYREAALFYDTRRSGLGAAFTLEVEASTVRKTGDDISPKLMYKDKAEQTPNLLIAYARLAHT